MRQEYKETPTAQDLKDMNTRISALRERAKKSKIEAKESFETQMKAVEDQYELIVAKMNQVSTKATKAGDEVKGGISTAWMNLKSSFDRASKYLH